MRTEVKKRLETCLVLWAAFVLLKWVMLMGPSSILSKLSPLMLAVRDGDRDYAISGWISLGVETVLTGVFCLIRTKKISVLYLVCTVYSLFYFPAVVYWIVTFEFEVWRYIQFLPVLACCLFMIIGCTDYIKQEKLVRPKSKPAKKQEEKEKEEKDSKQEE